MRLMFTHPRSTVRVLRMLMHLSACHVTLLPGEISPPWIFPQSDLGRRADSRWALPQICTFFQREIEMHGLTGAKFCTVVSTRPNFIMPRHYNLGAKNMQNLARFRATSKFGSEYLRNGWRYSKSDKYLYTAILPALGKTSRVKFGPVTLEISMWNRTHLKRFFQKTIFLHAVSTHLCVGRDFATRGISLL